MRWWSSVRPLPPQRPLNLAPSPPPRESTTSSLWCSNIGSPRLPRRRTHSTVRWAARSLSAPGWMPSCSVRTCSKQRIRSTGKVARRPHTRPKPIPKCQAIWWTNPGANGKVQVNGEVEALRRTTAERRSFYLPLTGHLAPTYLSLYEQPTLMSFWKALIYRHHFLARGGTATWHLYIWLWEDRLKRGGRWMEGERQTALHMVQM